MSLFDIHVEESEPEEKIMANVRKLERKHKFLMIFFLFNMGNEVSVS